MPKLKYNRSYMESILWLCMLSILLLVLIVPFTYLLRQAGILNYLYTEKTIKSNKCIVYLKKKMDSGIPSNEHKYQLSSGEIYFKANFDNEKYDNEITDCNEE